MATTSTTTVVAELAAAKTASCHSACRSSHCPPWLQAALADIEQRVQALAVNAPSGAASDSFAERAEHYYEKRPQLIALLQDLHHRYLYLADRYSQSLLKPAANLYHRRRSSSTPSEIDGALSATADFDFDDCASATSDAESSLSFQPPILTILTSNDAPPPKAAGVLEGAAPVLDVIAADLDLVVAELVSTAVEKDLLAAEAAEAGRRLVESTRKIELQGSLVEVLESERLVLLGENARLAFRASAAEEEARAGSAELGYMRRRAAELARAVVKLREDHRVCLLGRRIEGLQSQIYALERRNREYLDAMARGEKDHASARAEADRLRAENRRLQEEEEDRRARQRKWWGRKLWGRRRGKEKAEADAEAEWDPCTCAAHVRKVGVGKGDKGCFYF